MTIGWTHRKVSTRQDSGFSQDSGDSIEVGKINEKEQEKMFPDFRRKQERMSEDHGSRNFPGINDKR